MVKAVDEELAEAVAADTGDLSPRRPVHEIDPRVLAEIGSLAFRARIVADSANAGQHRSRHHGTSVEFAEHKEYSPGDNLRMLDWRAFARFDRDYIKRFEDESNLRSLFVVDSSASMGYPDNARAMKRLTKLEYAATCAGALAYVLARQGDAVGLATYSDRLNIAVPSRARRGHLQEILATLESLKPRGPSALVRALDALSEGLPRRTVVLILSDLLDGGIEALEAIKRLRARKHDVVLFHVLDPDEIEFPFEDTTLFEGMEDLKEINIDARAIRTAYLEEARRFLERAEQVCRSARVEYAIARTDHSPSRLLASFLFKRHSARATVR
jgi:uncharacterized protein (DUF58 family)